MRVLINLVGANIIIKKKDCNIKMENKCFSLKNDI